MRERTRAVAVIAGALVSLSTAPAFAAGPPVLHAGEMSVTVRPEPFKVEFRDKASGRVLSTVGGKGPGPTDPLGADAAPGYAFDTRIPVVNNNFLGYYVGLTVPTLWFHGVRVVSSERRG